MTTNEWISLLKEKFVTQVTQIMTTRERRIYAETTPENLVQVAEKLKQAGMINVGTMTGLDSGENFEVIYHFYDQQGNLLNMKVFTPRTAPKLPTITAIYPGVFLYEYELYDLLGIVVEGAPLGRRYPLPENWPAGEFPLRKDWKGLPPQKVEVRS